MALETTREERKCLETAEYNYLYYAKPMPPCPRCGKPLIIIGGSNGARTIRCQDSECISYTIRGL